LRQLLFLGVVRSRSGRCGAPRLPAPQSPRRRILGGARQVSVDRHLHDAAGAGMSPRTLGRVPQRRQPPLHPPPSALSGHFIAQLRQSPELLDLVEKLVELTKRPFEDTPTLREFIAMASGGRGLGFLIVRPAGAAPTDADMPRTARFPGLVDLVQVGDAVAFL